MSAPPKENAGLAPGAFHEADTSPKDTAEARDHQGAAVFCVRHDGRLRQWKHYSTLAEAEQVAAHLCRIGCPSVARRDGELPAP